MNSRKAALGRRTPTAPPRRSPVLLLAFLLAVLLAVLLLFLVLVLLHALPLVAGLPKAHAVLLVLQPRLPRHGHRDLGQLRLELFRLRREPHVHEAGRAAP